MLYFITLIIRCLFLSKAARRELAERWELSQYSAALALNAAAAKDCLLFTNQMACRPGEQWVQVAPWGEHPNVKGVQVTTPESVSGMIKAFNESRQRLGANFRGAPIYDRHPTKEELRSGIQPLGRIIGMEARSDGLYVNRRLNTKGKENDAEGYHPYPSIGWFVRASGQGKVVPVGIDHVAMVEHPNIGGVPAWTNSQPDEEEADNESTDTPKTMNPEMIKKLGLKPGCTQEEYDAALKGLHEAKTAAEKERDEAKAAIRAERRRAEAAELGTNAARAAHADTLLHFAINEGRISPAEKEAWRARLVTNAGDAGFAALTPRFHTQRLAISKTGGEMAGSRREANEKLSKLVNDKVAASRRMSVIEAHRVVCNDPANRELVLAANGGE